jgi:hypothetical protein
MLRWANPRHLSHDSEFSPHVTSPKTDSTKRDLWEAKNEAGREVRDRGGHWLEEEKLQLNGVVEKWILISEAFRER